MSIRKTVPILIAALLAFSALLFLSTPSFASDNVTVNVNVEQNVTVGHASGSPYPPPPPAPPAPPAPYIPPPPPHYPYYDWPYPYRWSTFVSPRVIVVEQPQYIIQPVPAPVQPQIQIDPPPVINSFSVDVASLQQGQTATLSWTVSDVLERDFTVTITPGIGTVSGSGSLTISPGSTTTYTLTATNVDGSVSASVTVSVAPAVYESASEATTNSEDSGFLSWLPGMGSGSGNNAWMPYALLIALLAAAAVAIILLATRRKPSMAPAVAGTGYRSQAETITSTGTRHGSVTGARFVTAEGENIALGGQAGTLGRNDLISLVSHDQADLISRQHLRFERKNGEYYIEDTGSTNGTRLNGVPITGQGRQQLKDNDRVDLGGALILTFKS